MSTSIEPILQPTTEPNGCAIRTIIRNSIPHIERRVKILSGLYKSAWVAGLSEETTGVHPSVFGHLMEWMPDELAILKKDVEKMPPASPLVQQMRIQSGLHKLYAILERNEWSNALGPYVAMLVRELAAKGRHGPDEDIPHPHQDEPFTLEDPSYHETISMHVYHDLNSLIMADVDASTLVPIMRCYILQLLCICPPMLLGTIIDTLPAMDDLVLNDLKCRIPVLRWIFNLHDARRLIDNVDMIDLMILALRDGEGLSDLSMMEMLADYLWTRSGLLRDHHVKTQGPRRLLRKLIGCYADEGRGDLPPLGEVAERIIDMLPLSFEQLGFMLSECTNHPRVAICVLNHIEFNLALRIAQKAARSSVKVPTVTYQVLASCLTSFREVAKDAGTLEGEVGEHLSVCGGKVFEVSGVKISG